MQLDIEIVIVYLSDRKGHRVPVHDADISAYDATKPKNCDAVIAAKFLRDLRVAHAAIGAVLQPLDMLRNVSGGVDRSGEDGKGQGREEGKWRKKEMEGEEKTLGRCRSGLK